MLSTTAAIVNLVASILAGMATVVLAIFARLPWKTMSQSNELVRDRWKRDDELRAEENKPKAVFLLKRNGEDQIGLWCANLGTVSFIVAKIAIEPLQGEQPLDIDIDNRSQSVIPVGREWAVDLGSRNFGGLKGNCGVRMSLYGPSGKVITGEQAYHLQFHNGICMSLSQGFSSHHPESIDCPDCKRHIAYFPVDGVASIFECRREIAELKRQFEASCPNHTSGNSRINCGTSESV